MAQLPTARLVVSPPILRLPSKGENGYEICDRRGILRPVVQVEKEGAVRMSHRVAAAAALLMAAACTGDSLVGQTPFTPTQNPAARATAIAIVSGNDQQAKAGERLGEPFVVRVTDTRGAGVSDVTVAFHVTSGVGGLDGKSPGPPGAPMTASAQTNANGVAQMTFEPQEVGRISVTAQATGTQLPLVTFTADATILVIEFRSMRFDPYAGFVGPCGLGLGGKCFSAVTAPVGTTVEWKTLEQTTYTVTSKSTPQGGTPFDSGTLTRNSRFRFVPAVVGTWDYHDKLSGLTAALRTK
jgi:hypothetical protein